MTVTTEPKTLELLEDVYTPIRDDTIDEEAGVIRNVKVLGQVSENGVTYTLESMTKGASLYEEKPVNIDHPERDNPKKERGVMESIGFLKDVKFHKDGLYGDLHYYKSHPYSATLLERARRHPRGFGLSHNADGRYERTREGTLITELRKVRSVDVVGQPGTTKGLFESVDPDKTQEEKVMKKLSLKQLVESYGSADEKQHISLLEDAAVLDREIEIEEPKEDAQGVVQSGLAQAIADIHASDKSAQEKLDEIEKVLAAETVLKEGEPEQVEEPEVGESNELESVKAELEKMKLEKQVMALCESESFKPSDVQMKALCLMESQSERVSLIEGWKGAGKPERSGRKALLEEIEQVGSLEDELAAVATRNK